VKSEEYIKTCVELCSTSFNMIDKDILHAVLGLGTEAGEIQDAVKRTLFYGAKLDEVNLKEEAGDLMWYLAILLNKLGISFEDVMETNVKKLKLRYPEKFTHEKALNRDLQGEREVLND